MADSKSLDGQMLAEAIGLEDAGEALEMVRGLLGSGVDVNAVGWDGTHPLSRAVWVERWDVTRLLLDRGAVRCAESPYQDDPLVGLTIEGPLDLLDNLLERCGGWESLVGDINGEPFVTVQPLTNLIRDSNYERIELLWDRGIGVLLDVPSTPFGMTPLAEASDSSDVRGVRWLLGRKADVNAQFEFAISYTALEYAVGNKHVEITRLLLEAGANPNIPTWMWNTAVDRIAKSPSKSKPDDPGKTAMRTIRDLVLAASSRFPPPTYPDGSRPKVWPPGD
ncbi:MAG: ankyrin repeat domain-containing protein [Phycisphaerales bacterium]